MKGFIHSFEPFGTVDGPGIRMVAFFTGCPIRCVFCHNPEIAWGKEGRWYSATEVLETFEKSQAFYRNGGGITFSGGEPLAQGAFLLEVTELFKEAGVHIAVDTSLGCGQDWIPKLLANVDLWMVSIKAITPSLHDELSGRDNGAILEQIRELNKTGANMVIRYVLIPGLTDTEEELGKLKDFLESLPKRPTLELLGYHTMGKTKWESMGLEYTLTNPDATMYDMARAKDFFGKEWFT